MLRCLSGGRSAHAWFPLCRAPLHQHKVALQHRLGAVECFFEARDDLGRNHFKLRGRRADGGQFLVEGGKRGGGCCLQSLGGRGRVREGQKMTVPA